MNELANILRVGHVSEELVKCFQLIDGEVTLPLWVCREQQCTCTPRQVRRQLWVYMNVCLGKRVLTHFRGLVLELKAEV